MNNIYFPILIFLPSSQIRTFCPQRYGLQFAFIASLLIPSDLWAERAAWGNNGSSLSTRLLKCLSFHWSKTEDELKKKKKAGFPFPSQGVGRTRSSLCVGLGGPAWGGWQTGLLDLLAVFLDFWWVHWNLEQKIVELDNAMESWPSTKLSFKNAGQVLWLIL